MPSCLLPLAGIDRAPQLIDPPPKIWRSLIVFLRAKDESTDEQDLEAYHL